MVLFSIRELFMTTLSVEGSVERRSVISTVGGWLWSRELRTFLVSLGLALIVFAGLLLVLGKDPIAT